ncbi:MAG: hypothetical protein K0A89_01720 [ANME-2 cluster archaeon]|nr:hypothetical protein [ANME-2 cluster archaeon]
MFFHKNILIIGFLISIIVLSGCTDNTGNEDLADIPEDTSSSDNTSIIPGNLSLMVIVDPLPDGYEILGTLPISDDYAQYSENIIDAREGAYRDTENTDVFLDIIELDSKQAALDFISRYKSQYIPLETIERFTSISFNGHEATRIVQYRNSGGSQIPKYQIIWNKENLVFLVRSNSHLESSSLELAKATGQ